MAEGLSAPPSAGSTTKCRAGHPDMEGVANGSIQDGSVAWPGSHLPGWFPVVVVQMIIPCGMILEKGEEA